jgi:uncharacterized protein YcgI (DUF1989 family)
MPSIPCASNKRDAAARISSAGFLADTMKVQWQAYLGVGSQLLSDMGRALMAITGDTSATHDCLCGPSVRRVAAAATIVVQRSIILTAGSVLVSNDGQTMMSIGSTSCAFHDTIGGAGSCESNSLWCGHHTSH